jgi:hypothetical protein
MLTWEKFAPSYVGKGGFAPIMRLTGVIGLSAGFLMFYQRSICVFLLSPSPSSLPRVWITADMLGLIVRFYGFTENKREVEMDMKEMVAKVKKGEPLYGTSTTTPYVQGMAARNSRYSGLFLHVIPWFNFVNHNQHGVDTAKYYQQAERELDAERTGRKL